MSHTCRVQPDVPAIHRAFDYSVPESLSVRVGSIVRVSLHGRRVRGWVLDDDVAPSATDVEADRLRPLLGVVSAGPPAEVVNLCAWAAWRWAGPLATFLRAASPPNRVSPEEQERQTAVYPDPLGLGHLWPGDAVIVVSPSTVPDVPKLVAAEGSTLVIDPSPTRAALLAATLRETGRDVVTIGSEHPATHRTRSWDRARGGACVVIGGRTTVWSPVPDLASVIVLDEADEALEDERAPTWNGRDVAVERARRAGATVRFVTPAPTVDALVAVAGAVRETATAGASGERPGELPRWPRVQVVDQRQEEPGHGLLSADLADALRRTVDRGERAVCVLNRTGRARLLACNTCRELARCERCGATVRQTDEEFVCAQCGTERPRVCLHCSGSAFRALRPGIGRVRDDLAALLPRAAVVAVDAHSQPLGQAAAPASDLAASDLEGAREASVLIGTEAVLHRIGASSSVGLVAFLELDQELLAPRVRAAEQALWLLARGARVLGIGGGGARPGHALLLQTRVPGHEVVQAVVESNPFLVADAERARRQALGFPPFGGLAELRGAGAPVAAACDALRDQRDISVLGPVGLPGVGSRRTDGNVAESSARALVKGASMAALCDALAQPAVDAARALGRLRIDVDPRRV